MAISGEFEDPTAEAKMDEAAHLLGKHFPDCLFVIVALTDDQSKTHYVSNMPREDAQEVMEDLIEKFQAKDISNSKLN